jgi:hypothetical protein
MPRPTRPDQLAKAEALAREKHAAAKRALAALHSAQREEQRKVLSQRTYALGKLAIAAGLADVDDATLSGLFTLVARLCDTPNPVAILDALMADVGGMPGTAVPACGHRADGVATS